MKTILLSLTLLLTTTTVSATSVHPTVDHTGGSTTANSYICGLNPILNHTKDKYRWDTTNNLNNLKLIFKARARHGVSGTVRGYLEFSRNGETLKTFNDSYSSDFLSSWGNDSGFEIYAKGYNDTDNSAIYDGLDQSGQIMINGNFKYHISGCKVIKKTVPMVEENYN